MPNCVSKSINGKDYVRIINTDEETVTINSDIKCWSLNHYVIQEGPMDNSKYLTDNEEDNTLKNNDRLRKIIENLRTSHMNKEEKDSLLAIIERYKDIFSVEGDKLSET